MAAPAIRLASCLLILLLGASLVECYGPAKGCPGGTYARTPDKFAPCRCGYRPGPGGGDCKQYPNGWCFPYQRRTGNLKCSSRVSFFDVDSGSGPKPQFVILRNYCDKGFSCRTAKDGPWCCPIRRVRN